MQNKSSILHIIHGLTTGGAEIDLLNKCIYLTQQHGYQMTVCCLMRRGELAAKFEESGIKVIGPIMRHRYDISAGWMLRKLLREPQWDIIHTHLCATNLIVWAILRTLEKQYRRLQLAGEHAMPMRWPRWVNALNRYMGNSIEGVLVPSHVMAEGYQQVGIPQKKLHVVPNGIDTERFRQIDQPSVRASQRQLLGLRNGEFVIGVVCRLVPIKNLPLLFHAIADLPVRLLIVGDGEEEEENLANLIQTHGWQDNIQLLGRRNDVVAFLAACDLFVLPSRSESFGIAVAEALLMTLPVVATNVGGIAEITNQGVCASLVPPDSVAELRTAIKWVIGNYSAAHEMAKQGRTFIEERYTIESCAERLHEIYHRLSE